MTVKALYSLSRKIAGFDFFPWLVMNAERGAQEIIFDKSQPTTGKWPLETVLKRFDSILWPGPALLGLKRSIGTVGNLNLAPYYQGDMVRLARQGVKFPRLKSVLPAGKERYTVTLRKTQRNPDRNSNEAAWRTFAAEIGARVIPDYDDEPIHLHERMALYAGAEMNFFTTNGPAMLCFFSEYPAMQFDLQKSPSTNIGVPYGEPLPWLLSQHHQIYAPDDLPVIREYFERWRNGDLNA